MSDLVAFLLARIEADEAAAQAARAGHWSVEHSRHEFDDGSACEAWGIRSDTPWPITNRLGETHEYTDVVSIAYDRDYGTPEPGIEHEPTAQHIARHDPARVLAECEAKRRIIELHTAEHECVEPNSGIYPADWPKEAPWGKPGEKWSHPILEHQKGPCPTLRLLTLPYAHHPDYDAAWRPA